MTLDEVKPWGRSLEEYRQMFNLTSSDLNVNILGCGDGPASFNAEMGKLGHKVVSVDPLYTFSKGEIERRVRETYAPILSQARASADRYVWKRFPTLEALGRARLRAMKTFLADFDAGLAEGCYLPRALPSLGFANGQFSLALLPPAVFVLGTVVARLSRHVSCRTLARCRRGACVPARRFGVQAFGASRACKVALRGSGFYRRGLHRSPRVPTGRKSDAAALPLNGRESPTPKCPAPRRRSPLR